MGFGSVQKSFTANGQNACIIIRNQTVNSLRVQHSAPVGFFDLLVCIWNVTEI